MGTVPDPLRSTKLSLVTGSEENGLGELPSSEHQHKQASIERNSNGCPFGAKVQPTGEQVFEVNCVTEANVPRGEQHCGYDSSHASMFSPESFSPSKEECVAALEPVNNSKEEASNGSRSQVLVESHSSEHTALKAPVTQETKELGLSHSGKLPCGVTDDKASSPSEGGNSLMKNKAYDPSFPLSSHPDTPQITSTVKEIVEESFGFDKNGSPTTAKELGYVFNLGLKAPVCSDAALKDTRDVSFHPGARTVPESVCKSKSEDTSQPSFTVETSEEAVPEHSRFKDTGTMTMQTDSKLANGEDVSRICQDAEVQAVASMESKSASTSPSIFAAFLKENIPSEAKQKQDQLHIIYTEASGKEQSKIVDNFVQSASSTGIMPEVHIQAPVAAKKKLVAQVAKRQDDPVGIIDAVHSASLDKSEHPFPLASDCTQHILVKEMDVQKAGVARYHSGLPQQMVDSSVLQKTRPVYQIPVHTTYQPQSLSHPVNIETTLPPCSTLAEVKNKHQHIELSGTENQPASPSCHRPLEENTALSSTAGRHGSRQGEQLQIPTVSDLETGLSSFHGDVKPKREANVVHPDPKEQETIKTEAVVVVSSGLQMTCLPVAAQKGQGKFAGTPKETEALGSQSLAVGLESELSSNSAPQLETKTSEMKKGPKCSLKEAPASIQPVASLGEKKKEPKSEAKVQLKHSKHVRDVVWDEQGMTWEVYGASLDPESLGIAIQNHLQRQIREHEKLIKAQNAQTRKSISSDTSSNKKLKGRQHNVFQSMLQNFRRPNCCVRPAASSVLD